MGICTGEDGITIGLYDNYSMQRVCCCNPGTINVSRYFVLGCVRHATTISRSYLKKIQYQLIGQMVNVSQFRCTMLIVVVYHVHNC